MKFNYIPVELPSKGLIYPEDNPFSSGIVEIRYPTAKDKDILTDRAIISKGNVIDEFLKNLIVDKNQKSAYDTLFSGDKEALLIASRILGVGPIYSVETQCKYCGTKNKLDIDLRKLEHKEINFDILNRENIYIYEVVNDALPTEELIEQSKIIFHFKLLSTKDLKEIEKEIERSKKLAKEIGEKVLNFEYRFRLRKQIIKIEIPSEDKVIDNPAEIYKFISDELPAIYITKLLSYINKISPGVDTSISFVCGECGQENELPMPLDYFAFFLPERQG